MIIKLHKKQILEKQTTIYQYINVFNTLQKENFLNKNSQESIYYVISWDYSSVSILSQARLNN